MKNDNDLHRLALTKENCAFDSKRTWKDCGLFPACVSSPALFHEDVMVSPGVRTSHSLLSRLDHICFMGGSWQTVQLLLLPRINVNTPVLQMCSSYPAVPKPIRCCL